MNDGVKLRHSGPGIKFIKSSITGHDIKHLSGICNVCNPIVRTFNFKRHDIQIQNAMPPLEQISNCMAPGFSCPPCEKYPHIEPPELYCLKLYLSERRVDSRNRIEADYAAVGLVLVKFCKVSKADVGTYGFGGPLTLELQS